MAAPTPPPIVLGLSIGLLGFVLYRMIKGLATPFSTVDGIQAWHNDQADPIRAELEQSRLEPFPGVERVWIVVPGAGALAQVRAIQAAKHIVTSSTNLLDRSAAKRLIAEVLPAEEKTLATGTELAILPQL